MKTASDPRHKERQKLVQELFAWDANKNQAISEKANSIIKFVAEIDSSIKDCAPEWEINRINQIDLAILRLGIFELVIEPIIPAKVVIDEAVELAKEFGNETSPAFINGALGKALRSPSRITQLVACNLGTDAKELSPDSALNGTPLEISDLLTKLERDYNLNISKENTPKTVGGIFALIEDEEN